MCGFTSPASASIKLGLAISLDAARSQNFHPHALQTKLCDSLCPVRLVIAGSLHSNGAHRSSLGFFNSQKHLSPTISRASPRHRFLWFAGCQQLAISITVTSSEIARTPRRCEYDHPVCSLLAHPAQDRKKPSLLAASAPPSVHQESKDVRDGTTPSIIPRVAVDRRKMFDYYIRINCYLNSSETRRISFACCSDSMRRHFRARLPTQYFPPGHVFDEHEVLMHHADSEGDCVMRRIDSRSWPSTRIPHCSAL